MNDYVEVYIDEDEWWPVYSASPPSSTYNHGKKAKIPASKLEDYKRIINEFEQMQNELKTLGGFDRE